MAIRMALLDGKTVYTEHGEELGGADLTCTHCGARLHLHRYLRYIDDTGLDYTWYSDAPDFLLELD